jgi:hypothetical protein
MNARSPVERIIPPGPAVRAWLLPTCLVALVWAVELFVFQERTLVPDWVLAPRSAAAARILRFALDLSACLFVVLLVRGRWLYPVLAGGCVFALALDTYHSYFGHALSLSTLAHQSGEGGAVLGYALSLVSLPFLAASAGLLALKIGLNEVRMRRIVAPRVRAALAAGAAGAYLGVFMLANASLDPLSKFRVHGTVDRMGVTYGYLPAWLGEAWYLRRDMLLQRALAAAAHPSDRLTPIETPLELPGSIVIVQVESLGADVLGRTQDGALVMPFLTRIRDAALSYRVRAIHTNGSADSDFVMLTGRMPSPDVITYKVRDYVYDRTLPQLSRRAGLASLSIHGNTGAFFERRPVFARMGFDRLLFREELEQILGRSYPHGGVEGVKDVDVFEVAARQLAERRGERTLCFIITLTSHAPFSHLEPSERELFPEPTSITQDYLNSMRYVDRALERFAGALDPSTTLVLYGDHGVPEMPNGDPELVPFLIFQPDRNLAAAQATRTSPLSHSGELTLQDAVLYLWHQLARQARDSRGETSPVRLTRSSASGGVAVGAH